MVDHLTRRVVDAPGFAEPATTPRSHVPAGAKNCAGVPRGTLMQAAGDPANAGPKARKHKGYRARTVCVTGVAPRVRDAWMRAPRPDPHREGTLLMPRMLRSSDFLTFGSDVRHMNEHLGRSI